MTANILIEESLHRKALIYAFQLITPSHQVLSKDFIHQQLQKKDMFQEFQNALYMMALFYPQSDIDTMWTQDRWLQTADATVVDFLHDYCSPYIALGRCSSPEAEAIFDLKPPLLKIEPLAKEEPMFM